MLLFELPLARAEDLADLRLLVGAQIERTNFQLEGCLGGSRRYKEGYCHQCTQHNAHKKLVRFSPRATLQGSRRQVQKPPPMPTLFTRIIAGEIPGRFVWKDEHSVAFMSIHPLNAGHTLVVPRQEVDHWLDLTPELAQHLMLVSQCVGKALQNAYQPVKIGLMIAGLEVPHTHLHVVPVYEAHDLDFARANTSATADELDRSAVEVRDALRVLGYYQVSD